MGLRLRYEGNLTTYMRYELQREVIFHAVGRVIKDNRKSLSPSFFNRLKEIGISFSDEQ